MGLICLIGTTLALGCSVYRWVKAYPQDNIVEEVAEEVLEHYTGWDIDLTPFSEED